MRKVDDSPSIYIHIERTEKEREKSIDLTKIILFNREREREKTTSNIDG